MANRYTLHVSHLQEFKDFLNNRGIAYRDGKGEYQVMQVLTARHGWQVVFRRGDMPEHYTVQDKLMPLVRKFLEERRTKKDAIAVP